MPFVGTGPRGLRSSPSTATAIAVRRTSDGTVLPVDFDARRGAVPRASDMEPFVIGVVLGATVVALFAAPLVAPWRVDIRWLIAAQLPDPIYGITPWPVHLMREVTVAEVLVHPRVVRGRPRAGTAGAGARAHADHDLVCTRSYCAPLKVGARIQEPLLLVVDELGAAQLTGPDATVTSFQDVSEHV